MITGSANQNEPMQEVTGMKNVETGNVDSLNNFIMESNARSNIEKIQTDDRSNSLSEGSHKRKILQTLDAIDLYDSDISSVSILE